MSLVTLDEARALVSTSLNDVDLQRVIDREEAWVISRCGPHYVDDDTTVTQTLYGGMRRLYLARSIASVESVTEDDAVLAADDYRIWLDEGILERLPSGTVAGSVLTSFYGYSTRGPTWG